jgi:hypothetical protein
MRNTSMVSIRPTASVLAAVGDTVPLRTTSTKPIATTTTSYTSNASAATKVPSTASRTM